MSLSFCFFLSLIAFCTADFLDFNEDLATSYIRSQYSLPEIYYNSASFVWFNYRWRTGQLINLDSYNYFSLGRYFNEDNYYVPCTSLFTKSSFAKTYHAAIQKVTYQLGNSDKARKQQLQELEEVKEDQLLDELYESFGPVTSNSSSNQIYAYWERKIYPAWICDPTRDPYTYWSEVLENATALYPILNCRPTDPQTNKTATSLYNYLVVENELVALIQQVDQKNSEISVILDILEYPTLENGGWQTDNGYVPAFQLDKKPYDIYYDLHNNATKKFSFTSSYYKTGNSTYSWIVDGKNATLPPEMLNKTRSLPVAFYAKFKNTFSTLVTLSINPLPYDPTTQTGWWIPNLIPDAWKAYQNSTYSDQESGYRFTSLPPSDTNCILSGYTFVLFEDYSYYYADLFTSLNMTGTGQPYTARIIYSFPNK